MNIPHVPAYLTCHIEINSRGADLLENLPGCVCLKVRVMVFFCVCFFLGGGGGAGMTEMRDPQNGCQIGLVRLYGYDFYKTPSIRYN